MSGTVPDALAPRSCHARDLSALIGLLAVIEGELTGLPFPAASEIVLPLFAVRANRPAKTNNSAMKIERERRTSARSLLDRFIWAEFSERGEREKARRIFSAQVPVSFDRGDF